ncbi:MAG: hypothetical protein IT448_06905 [Phycisphaerales bacterium]|nr:hypothetical protein [Phycisphaerales bacterium]
MAGSGDWQDNAALSENIRLMLEGEGFARDQASAELGEIIRRSAEEDIDADELAQTVLMKVLGDREKFLARMSDSVWVAMRFWVIKRHAEVDVFRKRMLLCKHFTEDEEAYQNCSRSDDKEAMRQSERKLDRNTPMLAADLAHVAAWPLRDRLILLPLVGLWWRVPEDKWSAWVGEYGLEPPYPPQVFLVADDATQRDTILAELFGLLPNTLSQVKCRGKERIQSLQCAQDLVWGDRS